MDVDLVSENGAEPDERTLADATELAQRIYGALCEAGRPDIAERIFIGIRDDGIYRPGVRTLWLNKAEERLAHRAFLIVGDYRYCFRCWRAGSNGCRAGALDDCRHDPWTGQLRRTRSRWTNGHSGNHPFQPNAVARVTVPRQLTTPWERP